MEKIKSNIKYSTNDLADYSKELYNKILNDDLYPVLVKEGWENSEIQKNVSKFKEYLDDMHKAKEIKTYEDCIANNMTQRLILVRNGKLIERNYETLLPFKEHTDYLNHFCVYDFNNLPSDASSRKCVKSLFNAISNKLKAGCWIYLYGAPRSGRSYAAFGILNDLHKMKKYKESTFGFADSILRFKQLNDLYFTDKQYFNELLANYSNVDFLVIDNFGSEYKNELIRDTILFPIIQERYAKNKLTIFTSDFTIEEVKELYSFKKYGRDIVSEKIINLIENKCKGMVETGSLALY